MSYELRQALEEVARRFRRVRLWSALTLCWLAWAFAGLGLYLISSRQGFEGTAGGWPLAFLAGLAAVTGIACAVLASRRARDPRWVARRIEARHPELSTALLAAVEQDGAAGSGKLGFLQTAVIRQALEHHRTSDWNDAVPTWTLRGSQLAHVASLALLIVASAMLAGHAYSKVNDGTKPATGVDALNVEVDPGNTELERGTSLLVVARFKGAVPAGVSLAVEGPSQGSTRRAMTRSLEDPTFAGRVESVDADLVYRVEFDGRSTETYHVKVYETPELQRADATMVFPRYTGLESKTVEDVRHVTAVEGTELTLLCRLNKDVAEARLVDEKGGVTTLAPAGADSHAYHAVFPLSDSHRYRVELVDRDGRHNKQKTEIVVNVTRNRPPTVNMAQPARDVRVSPVEELKLKAQLDDDFGVVAHGISYTLAGEEPKEITLNGPEKLGKRLAAEYLIDFELLRAVPDQLVTYFFWAEDIGPDGKARRTAGDMYFAEVRPFEEIFRQGEQPPGGSAEMEGQAGENAQESDRLAELQKQIINGTWKLIRRETGDKPTDRFAEDAKLLRESQHSAIEQATQLGQRLRDPKSKTELEKATQFMKDAEKRLAEAVDGMSIPPLRPALVAEQAAYQALLKLRAREFQVIRNNSRRGGRSGRSGGSPSQQQLDQLELSDEENRFEQQRSARPDQEKLTKREQEQREARQVLNRLRELAQRQTDLNDRLKELQSALEAAKSEEARKEIERQLKRLREQQEQILRDTDELRERMEREENRERMAQARQQIEEGRNHVREASKALEEGRLSRAITEGSRAGQQMNDLREQLRKETSDRFSQEMTEMRQQARQLDENQKKLSEQLDAWNKNPQQTLRDSEERKQVRQGLEQQAPRLDQLLERMRTTIQEAEETEPLLAKGLYDTVRKADEQKIPDTLKITRRLLDAGVTDDAAQASRHAGQGIEQLKQGVERAAERILGDETAALRRAQGELEKLGDQVDREIAQATGRDAKNPKPDAPDGVDPFDKLEKLARGPDANAQQPNSPRPEARQRGGGRRDPNRPGTRQQEAGGGSQNRQRQRDQQEQQAGQPGPGNRDPGQDRQESQAKAQRGGGLRGDRQSASRDSQQPQNGQAGGGGGPQDRQAGSPRGGRPSGLDALLEGPARGPGGPITGEGFREWSDRMRDVEELLDDPELRGQAARIRDRARGAREEFKRHAKEPDWNQLKTLVAQPLRELGQRIAEEVRRRESPDSLVPIDRDPVPPQYAEGVRRYYERLGSGQ
jgi:hypothetical protein